MLMISLRVIKEILIQLFAELPSIYGHFKWWNGQFYVLHEIHLNTVRAQLFHSTLCMNICFSLLLEIWTSILKQDRHLCSSLTVWLRLLDCLRRCALNSSCLKAPHQSPVCRAAPTTSQHSSPPLIRTDTHFSVTITPPCIPQCRPPAPRLVPLCPPPAAASSSKVRPGWAAWAPAPSPGTTRCRSGRAKWRWSTTGRSCGKDSCWRSGSSSSSASCTTARWVGSAHLQLGTWHRHPQMHMETGGEILLLGSWSLDSIGLWLKYNRISNWHTQSDAGLVICPLFDECIWFSGPDCSCSPLICDFF